MTSKYKGLISQAWLVFFSGFMFTTLLVVTISRKIHKENIPSESDFTSDITHKAKCGLDQYNCLVQFRDGKLLINDIIAIKRSRFRSLVKSTECRQRFILFPILIGCFKSQFDRDFTISYLADNDLVKSIQISFRPGYIANQSGWKNFQADFQTWTGDLKIPLKQHSNSNGVRRGPSL